MKKIKYNIKIGFFLSEFSISEIYSDQKIIRYAKTALKKMGIDYNKIIKDELGLDVSKCPFCNSDSDYEIIWNINHSINQVEICNIKYNIANGKKNYHCKGGKKNCTGSLLNPNSIEYISRAFKMTKEEANLYLIDRNKSPFYSKNHKDDLSYKNYQKRDLSWYLEKYGEDGYNKFNIFRNKVSIGNSKNYLIEKYGVKEYEEIAKKKAVCNLNFFIEKYGEELAEEKFNEYKKSLGLTRDQYINKFGEKSWEERRKKVEYKKSLEYFIQNLGYKEGLESFNSLRKSFSFTKDDYINKYGEEKWINRWKKCNRNFYSEESSTFFNLLIRKLEENFIKIENIKYNDNEFFLWDSEYRRIYFYDFYFELNGKKIIIEYDNYFWHPKKGENDKNALDNLNFISNFTKEGKIEYDERKKMWARYKGYELISLFYNDKNPIKNIKLWDNLFQQTIKEIKKY